MSDYRSNVIPIVSIPSEARGRKVVSIKYSPESKSIFAEYIEPSIRRDLAAGRILKYQNENK